ncbi:MAG: ATP-binding protein [Anaerolineales bacterium]|nr:ATP-binding protein [Anaerolineales bacterium]MCA9996868.1 ATP-binding protein [Anaerolineales bacterium]
MTPFLHTLLPDSQSAFHHALFAVIVSSVPDLSSYEQFEQVDELEQLRRVLNAQRLLLMGVNVQPDPESGLRALELRYIWDGKRLQLAYIGKGAGRTPDVARSLAQELWEDLNKLFPRDFYRGGLRPATDAAAFFELYQPFDLETAQIVSLEKQVALNHLLRSGQAYAVPHPYKWGISSMAGLCKTLLRQERPHLISLLLVPWAMHDDEIKALNTLAGALRKAGEGREKSRRMGMTSTLATGSRQVSSRDQFGQQGKESFLPDPHAKMSAEIYEGYLERLERPLLFRPYIAANGPVDASVVGALEAEMVGYIPQGNDQTKETALPQMPRERWLNGGNLSRARLDLQRLDVQFLAGQDTLMREVDGRLASACHQLSRLPFLVDVQEASCAFRLPALPYRDEIGLPVHSGAFVTLAQTAVSNPLLPIGQRDDGTTHYVHLHDLTKHILVVGTTGSGKTTTCLHLLAELAEQQIPFLVIEPVNAEHNDYRALLRLPSLQNKLQIFTLGDEDTAPFRLNPFEIQRGVTVNEHISAMLTAFKAAIPMWEPLPRLFLKALNRTYYRYGWTAFRKPTGKGDPPFPTMRDFYRELSQVVDYEIEHEGEVKGNIRGASKLRIEALLEGSCGRILSARQSLPITSWMETPTILELRHIGDDEDKALMMAFVLLAVNEYLDKGRPRQQKGQLQHVILIEEAHRLLENSSNETSAEQANTKGQAAQAFARALAENRKYGEGIMIAEQLPTKLVPDVIGNTGLKVMHRLTSADDREVMGRAMKFNEFQEEHVVTLRTGQAVVYGLDTEEPLLMQAPNFWQDWEAYGAESQPVSDAELADKMRRRQRRFAERFVPFTGCRSCPAPCTMRDHGEALTFDKSLKLVEGFIDVCAGLDEVTDGQTAVRHLAQFVTQAVDKHASVKLRGVGRETVVYCLFLQLNEASGLFSPEQSRLWEKEFRRLQALIT